MLVVSILNYCSGADTARCINEVHGACGDIPHRFIVGDHSPNPEVQQIGSGLEPDAAEMVLIYAAPQNPGFAAGHNRNFREAKCGALDTFLILNNDVALSDNALIVEMMSECREKTLVGCVIEMLDSKEIWFAGARVSPTTGDIKILRQRLQDGFWNTDVLCGCCIMIRAHDFEFLGGFDEQFFMYAEDIDLSFRARNAGFSLRIVNRTLKHAVGSGEDGVYSNLYLFENTKNRLICLRRHGLGLPLVGQSYFVLKYLFARTVQLALRSDRPIEQTKIVLSAFVHGFRSSYFSSPND